MEQRDKLIRLAARILMTKTPPSPYLSDYKQRPKHIPIRWWREIVDRIFAAEDERKGWAREIREIADSLKTDQPFCTWTEDSDGNWNTGCGNTFVFEDGGPDENHFIYCPYCGEEIDVAKYNPED